MGTMGQGSAEGGAVGGEFAPRDQGGERGTWHHRDIEAQTLLLLRVGNQGSAPRQGKDKALQRAQGQVGLLTCIPMGTAWHGAAAGHSDPGGGGS